MIQIRCDVFETNSSSTHSVGISSKSAFESWAEDMNEITPESTLLNIYSGTFDKAQDVFERCKRNGNCDTFEEFRHFFCPEDEVPEYNKFEDKNKYHKLCTIRDHYRTHETLRYDSISGRGGNIETCEYAMTDGVIVATSVYVEE